MRYKHGLVWSEIQNLPRIDHDLEEGDLALVFYIPSTYTGKSSATFVSFNLCGVVLIADHVDD